MVDVFCNFICNEENYFNCFDILVLFLMKYLNVCYVKYVFSMCSMYLWFWINVYYVCIVMYL